jgi:vacuolar-type H+-ATPase subunit H
MAHRRNAAAQTDATRAIERVLRAESDAATQLEAAQDAARQALEQARDEALVIVKRAGERAARWRQRHAEALATRLAALRWQQVCAAEAGLRPGDEAIAQAVRAVAAQLTTGDNPARCDDARP